MKKKEPSVSTPLMTCKEAAAFLRMTTGALSNFRLRGTGPAYYRKRGMVYYLEDDLKDWVLSGRIEGGKKRRGE